MYWLKKNSTHWMIMERELLILIVLAYALKHPVPVAPAPCLSSSCANRSSDVMTETRRCAINHEVNHLDHEVRKQWSRAHVKLGNW